MADFLNNLLGGSKSASTPVPSAADSDFADFADAAAESSRAPVMPNFAGSALSGLPTGRPYTKWYNIHERFTWSDFRAEGIILLLIAVILAMHVVGTRLNRAKARAWIKAHAAALSAEFAVVGFAGVPTVGGGGDEDAMLEEAGRRNAAKPEALLKEKSLFEFASYATGRQNIAFMDVRLTLMQRFNPAQLAMESVTALFLDSIPAPRDSVEAIIYPFDGKEAQTVPALPGGAELRAKDSKSAYDGFVWAIVNKDKMKEVRDDRYDVSITVTKDSPKLPAWLSVMSESAEITDALLTPELVQAAEAAGDLLDYIIITDQPKEKPKTIDETTPRKRILLKYRLPSNDKYDSLLPLFTCFVRLPDLLVQAGKFRPEVMRKIRNTREETVRQIQKVDENEKAEERAAERERLRKEKRDRELAGLDAKAQKKYLEKEKEREMRKAQKRSTMR